MNTKVIIISVPYTEPLPMVAPVLLSACLNEAGISAKGIDLSVNFLNEFISKPYWGYLKNWLALGTVPSQGFPRRAIIDVLKFIHRTLKKVKEEHDPEYIGLSLFSHESIEFSYWLIPYIRKYLPNTKIILGGRGLELICGVYNIRHYEKYHKYGMADVLVVGDAETAIIDAIKNNATGIHFAQQQTKEDLDAIPVPNWNDYDFEIYQQFVDYEISKDHNLPESDPRYIAISGSKGCIRKCTFCDVASFWPKYIYREGQNIARDIIENYRRTGIRNYRFTDNLMNGSVSHYRKMNEILAHEISNTINYSGYAIFRNKEGMPAEDFETAARAGCNNWVIGVESGSEKIRFQIKKNLTDDDMDHSILNLHKNKIQQGWLLMVGYPTETEEDYLATEDLLKRYAHLNKNGLIKFSITPTFQLLHNSPILQSKELVESYGLNYNINDNLSRYFWTAEINPENTFLVRYDRFRRLFNLAKDLGYTLVQGVTMDKWQDELKQLVKIYDEYKPKKVFTISTGQ
jgi:hypothetical protein